MKVTVERAELLKSLGHVHRVVERRNTIPILANVLLRADQSKLSLKATDLDLEVTDTDRGRGRPRRLDHGAGAHVLRHRAQAARGLADRARILRRPRRAGDPRRPLALHLADAAGERLSRSRAGEMTHKFTLTAADLKRLIDKTQFAISTEETRYYLNGIYLHAAGSAKAQTLRAVATDGHRLAQIELELPKGAAGMPGIIVPRKTVSEVQRLIEDNEAEVAIELSSGKIRFTIGDVVLTSKLIDGTFPDYARVIPLATTRSWWSTRRNSRRRSIASRRCRASAAAP